jgi:Skp family chaperone for outer membrane proteins
LHFNKIQSKQKEYEVKVKGGATQAQLELIQKSYERLVQEYQETEQAGQQDMQAQRGLLLKPIVEDIKKAIGVVAAAKGYSNVIDNATGMVLWSANSNDDITAAVIKHMTATKK